MVPKRGSRFPDRSCSIAIWARPAALWPFVGPLARAMVPTEQSREGAVGQPLAAARRRGLFVAIVLSIGISQALAEAQHRAQPSWLDPALLEGAKKEGSVVVYTSTNEREGLPL